MPAANTSNVFSDLMTGLKSWYAPNRLHDTAPNDHISDLFFMYTDHSGTHSSALSEAVTGFANHPAASIGFLLPLTLLLYVMIVGVMTVTRRLSK